jgi:hypothetical protein
METQRVLGRVIVGGSHRRDGLGPPLLVEQFPRTRLGSELVSEGGIPGFSVREFQPLLVRSTM